MSMTDMSSEYRSSAFVLSESVVKAVPGSPMIYGSGLAKSRDSSSSESYDFKGAPRFPTNRLERWEPTVVSWAKPTVLMVLSVS